MQTTIDSEHAVPRCVYAILIIKSNECAIAYSAIENNRKQTGRKEVERVGGKGRDRGRKEERKV